MSEEKLGNLRNKLKRITELIDAADQRKVDAKHSIVEALARLEKSEGERSSDERRIQLLQKELDDALIRLKFTEDKLAAADRATTEFEEKRNELEGLESTQDENVQKIEEDIKEAKRNRESNETKCSEAERKIVVITRDTEKVKEKANALEKRVSLLEETIEKASKSLQELEEREGESSKREELNEEKFRLLEGQVKDAEVRAEAAERSCGVLELNITETENEIHAWIRKRERIEQEMKDMDLVADEDNISGLNEINPEMEDKKENSPYPISMFGDRQNSATPSKIEHTSLSSTVKPPNPDFQPFRQPSMERPLVKLGRSEEEEESEEESDESDFDI